MHTKLHTQLQVVHVRDLEYIYITCTEKSGRIYSKLLITLFEEWGCKIFFTLSFMLFCFG